MNLNKKHQNVRKGAYSAYAQAYTVSVNPMYFGSVKFFRHLILTVFFGWLGAATVLAVFFGVKCHFLREEINTLSGSDADSSITAAQYISIMNKNGISNEDILEYIRSADSKAFGNAVADALSQQAMAQPEETTAPDIYDEFLIDEDVTSAPETTTVTAEPTLAETTFAEASVSDTDTSHELGEESTAVTAMTEPIATLPAQAPAQPVYTEPSPESTLDGLHVSSAASSGSDNKTVYLTFEQTDTEHIFDLVTILSRQNVCGTFFISDVSSADAAECISLISGTGNSIGILCGAGKSYSTASEYLSDFNAVFTSLCTLTDTKPDVCRIPDNINVSAQVMAEIKSELTQRGFSIINANVAPNCGRSSTWQSIYDDATDGVFLNSLAGSASIVELSSDDGSDNAILTAEDIISGLLSEGYKFKKLDNSIR